MARLICCAALLQVAAASRSVINREVHTAVVTDEDAHAHHHHDHPRISPPLDPESDEKFYKRDYPDDLRPKLHKSFDMKHPYPIVQDSEDYDKDYVKDENSDGGEWKAQTEYDNLKNSIRKKINDVEKAKKNEENKMSELEVAKKAEKDAEEKATEAESNADAARGRATSAEDEVEDLTGAASGNATKGAVGDSVGEVEKEMRDLEDCKKGLASARKRLKQLLGEKIEREKVKQLTEADIEKYHSDEESGSEDAEKFKSTVQKERSQHMEALKSYEKEQNDVVETQAALDKAAKRLRDLRRGVDPDGGVYYKKGERSAAHSSWAPALLPLVLAAVVSAL